MEITAEIVTAFRTSKKAYQDPGQYPDETVIEALCEGDAETGGAGWGAYDIADCQNFKGRGMYLFAAHWLKALYPKGAECPEIVTSDPKFAVSSKSVGDESVTFATGSLDKLSVGDGWIASTAYGQQWLRLRKRAGMGARTTGHNARVLNPRSRFNGLC